MKRLALLVAVMMLVGLLGAMPAFAQDNGFEGPYVEPGVEEPAPTPAPRVEPAPVEVAPVVVDRPAPPVARALPVTGFDLTVGAVLAAGLLLAGGGALFAARRKAIAAH